MAESGKIFAYCERGLNPAFWAEPLNAVTNLGFIIACLACIYLARRRPRGEHGFALYFLIATLFAIGAGSFLFHTLATPRAALGDVIPIGIFMLAYFGYALRNFLRLNLIFSVAGVAGFAWLIYWAGQLRCANGRIGFFPDLPASACFNGSVGYFPAFLAMLLIGGLLVSIRHPAGRWVLTAGLVFAISLTFRTFDRAWCPTFTYNGIRVGTHFLWHILNSLTLFLLLVAAIRHGAYWRRAVKEQVV